MSTSRHVCQFTAIRHFRVCAGLRGSRRYFIILSEKRGAFSMPTAKPGRTRIIAAWMSGYFNVARNQNMFRFGAFRAQQKDHREVLQDPTMTRPS